MATAGLVGAANPASAATCGKYGALGAEYYYWCANSTVMVHFDKKSWPSSTWVRKSMEFGPYERNMIGGWRDDTKSFVVAHLCNGSC